MNRVPETQHGTERAEALVVEADPLVGTLLSEVDAEQVDWLWHGYIPLGKLTVLDGDPGLGKSTLTLDIAACVSTGRGMPNNGSGMDTAAGVVLLSAEDGLADTIKPRLEAAGADCSRIVAITGVPDENGGDRPPVVPGDLDFIRRAIERVEAKLLIIDPLMAFLSGDIASHRDQDVRRALHLVASLAETAGVAILVVRHLNKSSGSNSLYRGGGSIGIIGAARSGLLVAPDPDDENRRVLASIKSNLCHAPKSLSFHLSNFGDVARVAWDGESPHTANALLATPMDSGEGDALAEAKDVLAEILNDGRVAVNEVMRQAQAAGVSKRTLQRAKKELGVRSHKDSMGGGWSWEMPEDGPPPSSGNLGNLRENDPRDRGMPADHTEDSQNATEGGQTLELKPQVSAEGGQDSHTDSKGHLDSSNDAEI